MSVFYVLVPLALLLAGAGVLAFRWAVRDGQYDDVETPALRMLLDDEVVPPGPRDTDSHDSDPR
jgi:cbb3-type cytochrome oxidase maturation protein